MPQNGMTILVVALLGAGILLITSAIEDCDIVSSFQHIIGGQKIDWTGATSPCKSSSGTGTTPIPKSGQCPPNTFPDTTTGQCVPIAT